MAGMFSLLNSYMNGEVGQPGISGTSQSRDSSTWGRNAPNNLAQSKNRKTQRSESNLRSIQDSKEKRITKRKKKQRKFSLHPLLRRGLCTIIVAFVILITGIAILAIEHFLLQNPASVFGWIAVSVGIFLILAGLAWFRMSQLKLMRMQISRERMKLKKLQKQFELNDQSGSLSMMYMTSHHVAPWPSKNSCPETTEEMERDPHCEENECNNEESVQMSSHSNFHGEIYGKTSKSSRFDT